VTRQARGFPGAAYDLGYLVVWCPKYRRPVLGGRMKTRLEDLIHAMANEHGWQTMRRYIETQYERAPEGGGRA
jgi:putative transposase